MFLIFIILYLISIILNYNLLLKTLIDTQEAPKSLSLCSSSSLESVVTVEDDRQNDSPLKPSSTNTLRVSGSNGSGAFTSYVRKRGEPDGRTASDASTQITKVKTFVCFLINFKCIMFYFFY